MKPTIFTLLLATALSIPYIANAQMSSTAPAAAASSSTSGTLNPRSLSSAQITQLQQTLKSQGYNVTADGVWGQSTVSALKKFQTAKGLPANGTLTSETTADLGIDLSSGASAKGQSSNTPAANNNLNPAAGGADDSAPSNSSTNNAPSSSGSTPNTGTGSTAPGSTGSGGTY